MFRCMLTGQLSKPGEKQFRLVVETRPATYHEWRMNEETRRKEHVEVGTGFETVKELLVCEDALQVWETMTEEHRQRFRD